MVSEHNKVLINSYINIRERNIYSIYNLILCNNLAMHK